MSDFRIPSQLLERLQCPPLAVAAALCILMTKAMAAVATMKAMSRSAHTRAGRGAGA